jgi:single-strand DNA-binding protein
MLTVTASGNITRDAQLRAAGDTQVCSFGLACNRKVKGEDVTVFLDCSVFGQRGEKLNQHLTKGKKVFVTGELSTRVHEGKTYLQCRVSELDFGGGGAGAGASNGKSESKSSGGGYEDRDYSPPADDNLPF